MSDLTAHLALPLGPAAGAASATSGTSGGGGWEPWSGHDPVTVLTGPEAAMQRRNVLLGLLAEVCVHHWLCAPVSFPNQLGCCSTFFQMLPDTFTAEGVTAGRCSDRFGWRWQASASRWWAPPKSCCTRR